MPSRLAALALMLSAGCGAPSAEPAPRTEKLSWTVPGDGRAVGDPATAPMLDTASPTEPAHPPAPAADAPFEPLPTGRVTDLCRDAALERVRRAVPEAPLCAPGLEARFVMLSHDGHRATVVGWRDERPSWVDGPIRYGAAALVDGRRLEGEPDGFWRALPDLDQLPQPEIPTLLQAVLLAGDLYPPLVDRAATREALRGWEAALDLVAAEPPGMLSDVAGHHLRAYGHRRTVSRGGGCRFLMRQVATLTRDGRVVVHPAETWATGEQLGRPCGDPLPE